LPSQELSFAGKDGVEGPDGEIIEKQKPNFGNSGILAREANTIAGTNVVLKYNEPAEARKPPPSQAWRLYIFKGEEVLDTVPLHTQSCWLLGRETTVVDLPVEHPSSSKQHAVIQFRYISKLNEFGDRDGKVKPYIIDLESSNGTVLNGEKIEASRFVEVRTGDVMKIGLSEREYVFILPPPE
jgi:smad nuclear-interacting protein 1